MTKPNFSTHIINDYSTFVELQTHVKSLNAKFFVLDVESDSKIEKLANLYGIGFCFDQHEAFYIPIRTSEGTKIFTDSQEQDIAKWILELSKTHKLIGHNIIYDVLVLENCLGITLDNYIYSDTILQKHTLSEEPPFALKENAVQRLGSWADLAQDRLKDAVVEKGGKWTKEQKDMYLAPTEILGEYCCWDVILTYLLFEVFEKQLKEENLTTLFYEEEVMPLYREVTINMKRKGFPIDMEHFTKLNEDLAADIIGLEDEIMNLIKKDVQPFIIDLLEKQVPVKPTGTFPKAFAEVVGVKLPIAKNGKITLSKSALEKEKSKFNKKDLEWKFFNWLTQKGTKYELLMDFRDPGLIYKAQEKVFFSKAINEDKRYVFNLKSNDHLTALIVDAWGIMPTEKTDSGKYKIDSTYLETLSGNPVIDKLLDLKKLNKLKSTYIEGILDRQIDGVIYASMLQFGTTSGRYASRNPNLQNLPRPKGEDSGESALVLKYSNAIREGFVPMKGYKIVDADYSALEPRCFSHACGDFKLKAVWNKGEDLYSRIAIDVFQLNGVSAHPDDDNYLQNLYPEFRQKAKVFCLAVVYGAEESRISQAMKCDFHEARKVINAYLKAYPGLKKYMNKCNFEAKTKGYVTTDFGRVRHLPKANSLYTLYGNEIIDFKYAKMNGLQAERRSFKTLLNNSKNFPIQGLAAHIVNRAAIAISRRFKEERIDGYVSLQVHDQLISLVKESQTEKACKIIQDCMENTTKISVPLVAKPAVADNLKESH